MRFGSTHHWRNQWWKKALRGLGHTSRGGRTWLRSILRRNQFWTSVRGPLGGQGRGCPGGGGNSTVYIGGGEEEGSGSGGIGQRVDDRRGGGNAPRKYDGPGMRAGVQSSNLT